MSREYGAKLKDARIHDLTYNIILGSEGCIYKCCNELDDFLKHNNIYTNLRIVTPPIPYGAVESLYGRILLVCEQMVPKVIFNDYGLLLKCKELIVCGKLIAVLGRVLTRSFCDCPWADMLCSGENDLVKKMLSQNSFIDENIRFVLDDFCIHEIEMNYAKNLQKKSYPNICIVTYASNILLAVQRNCPTARLLNLELPYCKNKEMCGEKFFFTNKEISEYTHQQSAFFIQENCVYMSLEKPNLVEYDMVIL